MNKSIKNIILIPFHALYKISPEFETKLLWRIKKGSSLCLSKPETYNEKINWIKLHYRNDLMPICADKFLARGYINDKGFGEYLPKLYWHGDNANDIPFDSLPNSFVIKSTSGSGNNIIVHDKQSLDIKAVRTKVNKWLKEHYLLAYGEWHYEKIKPTIMIEELLTDGENVVPIDYKLFCFNNFEGETKVGCVAVDLGRFVDHKRNIYDRNFVFLPEVDFGFKRDADKIIEEPHQFKKMCQIAETLSAPFPHCRVDFFVINGRFYVGEMTFFNGAGFDMVSPRSYNELMGSWIDLSKIRKEELI